MTAYLFITKVGVCSQHPRVPKVSKYLPLFERRETLQRLFGVLVKICFAFK